MRYDRANGDWVEIEGAADMPMEDLIAIEAGGDFPRQAALIFGIVKACEFKRRDGTLVEIGEAGHLLRLSPNQWRWLQNRVFRAARDEALDPEA